MKQVVFKRNKDGSVTISLKNFNQGSILGLFRGLQLWRTESGDELRLALVKALHGSERQDDRDLYNVLTSKIQ